MTKTQLEEMVRKVVKEESDKYFRAHKKQIGNDLYAAMQDLKDIFQSLNNGNDFHPEKIDQVIKYLNNIKKTAQTFDKGTMPIDKNYR